MNTELVNKVLAWLDAGAPHEKTGFSFDMSSYVHDGEPCVTHPCGTTCCMAGAAIAFASPAVFKELRADSYDVNVKSAAAALLDIPVSDADELFSPIFLDYEYADVTPALAANVLRKYVKTGKVVWPRKP